MIVGGSLKSQNFAVEPKAIFETTLKLVLAGMDVEDLRELSRRLKLEVSTSGRPE